MVSWPALLKLYGDDELIYLGSLQQCVEVTSEMILGLDDYLVDSLGNGYQIVESKQEGVQLKPSDVTYSAEQVTDLIQAHEFNAAQVCITKIYFPTVADAIKAMA